MTVRFVKVIQSWAQFWPQTTDRGRYCDASEENPD